MLFDVLYFAPPGATITVSIPVPATPTALLARARRAVAPRRASRCSSTGGQTRTVSYTSALPEGDLGPLSVRYSPTVTDTPVTVARACAER